MRAAATRLARAWRLHLLALLLLLAACSGPGTQAVVVREGADARLATRVREGLFLTTVRIDDREAGPFLIDTGASHVVLDTALAKLVDLSLWGEVDHPESGQLVKRGSLASLEVGPLTLRQTEVVVMDLSAPSRTLGERIAGILGHPFFARAVVEVDYPARSIACFDPETYRLPRGGWLPLTFQAGRPIVSARLEGGLEGRFMLDTGSTSSVHLYPEFVRAHAPLESRVTGRQTIMHVGGPQETRTARVAWFELAGRRFDQPLVNLAPRDAPGPFPEGIAGLIGQGLLRHFTIVFNYHEARIALLPR